MGHDPAEAISIRPACPADEAVVAALLKASYAPLMAPFYEAEALAAVLPAMTRANPHLLASGTYYLALDFSGQAVGCGGWTRARPGDGEVVPGLAHLRHFGTHPDWVRRGVGRALCRRCAEEAAAQGVRRLQVYASLNAQTFYGAQGFRVLRPVTLPFGPEASLPAVLMECAL